MSYLSFKLPLLSVFLSLRHPRLFSHPVNNLLTLTDVEVDLYLQKGHLVLLRLSSHVRPRSCFLSGALHVAERCLVPALLLKFFWV